MNLISGKTASPSLTGLRGSATSLTVNLFFLTYIPLNIWRTTEKGCQLGQGKGIVSTTPEKTEIIFKSKQSLLWHKDEAWMKKGDGDVDVTMGSYDGAETCDLVGLYLLDQMKDLGFERKPFYAGNN